MKVLFAFVFVLLVNTLSAQVSVSGRCINSGGMGVGNLSVTAILFDEKQNTTTASDGSFSFQGLNPGEWTIIVESDGRKTLKKIQVKNSPVEIEIVVGKQD